MNKRKVSGSFSAPLHILHYQLHIDNTGHWLLTKIYLSFLAKTIWQPKWINNLHKFQVLLYKIYTKFDSESKCSHLLLVFKKHLKMHILRRISFLNHFHTTSKKYSAIEIKMSNIRYTFPKCNRIKLTTFSQFWISNIHKSNTWTPNYAWFTAYYVIWFNCSMLRLTFESSEIRKIHT